jgi:hypothetical protein
MTISDSDKIWLNYFALHAGRYDLNKIPDPAIDYLKDLALEVDVALLTHAFHSGQLKNYLSNSTYGEDNYIDLHTVCMFILAGKNMINCDQLDLILAKHWDTEIYQFYSNLAKNFEVKRASSKGNPSADHR